MSWWLIGGLGLAALIVVLVLAALVAYGEAWKH